LVCRNCFTEVDEANIVNDISFGEDSRGAAQVQGGFVGETARHGNTLGTGIARVTGAGERNAVQEVEKNARRSLDKLCPTLGIPENTRNQAVNIYSLASRSNFSAGRRTDEVAAACLYAACRRQKDNQVMLIDISELLQMNVFRLGEVYKAMCKDIHLQDNGGVGTQYLVEVESLIMKYCRKLEFGEATRQVAEDAVKIVRRMKRDWMVTGRHPAGLCGACIILAARMNNFRRSTREVVYVAKVADITIMKRVEEFRRTRAAALTVDQFREYGVRIKHQHDPPALHESQLKQIKFDDKKRKRQASTMARDTVELSENGSVQPDRGVSTVSATPGPEADEDEERRKRRRTETGEPATPPATQQESRRDADGFLIPRLPNDQTPQTPTPQTPIPAAPQGQGQNEEAKRKRGRPKKTPPEPIIITEEELAEEEQLETDINDNLNDDEIIDSRNEIEKAKDEERAKQIADQEKRTAAERTKARREAEGITWVKETDSTSLLEVSSDDLESEFANDPEVQNCLLSDAEQKVKEQIWVLHNEDWLRNQQEKKLLEAVHKAAGRTAQGKKKGAKVVKRKRKGKMGDGTTLAEATTPIETPADASRAMIEKRSAQFSKYLNWDVLNKVFEQSSSKSASTRGSATPNESTSQPVTPSTGDRAAAQQRESATPTPAPSDASGLRSPPATQQAGAGAARPVTPDVDRASATPAPATPPQTQVDAEDDMDLEGDEDDYVQDDDLDYGSPSGNLLWGRDDDREDFGEDEDDFHQAIGRTGGVSNSGEYVDDDFE
jgi:transcription factor IIIB subunit 2